MRRPRVHRHPYVTTGAKELAVELANLFKGTSFARAQLPSGPATASESWSGILYIRNELQQ